MREVGTLAHRLPADMVVMNPEHRAKAEEIWGSRRARSPQARLLHTMDMFRAFMRGDVKVMWTQTTNPWVSIPNLNRISASPATATLPDRQRHLPDADHRGGRPGAARPPPGSSAKGVFGNSERRTQHWDKAVDPPGEATEDAWQIIEVAKRMGMGHLFPWPEDDWHEPMYEEYRSFTLGLGKDVASYEQLEETRGMFWPVVDGKSRPGIATRRGTTRT